jgi:hypothetical protein
VPSAHPFKTDVLQASGPHSRAGSKTPDGFRSPVALATETLYRWVTPVSSPVVAPGHGPVLRNFPQAKARLLRWMESAGAF